MTFARAFLVNLLLLGTGSQLSLAAESDSKKPAEAAVKANDAKAADNKPVDAKLAEKERRESIAWAFIMQHHPELAEVLSRLKLANQGEYDKALLQVWGTAERIAKFQKDDAKRADLELQAWKIDSRIRLMAARMAVSISDSYDRQLLAALTEQNKIRIKLMEAERERTLARVKSMESTIKKAKDEEKKDVDAKLQDLMKEINRQRTKQGLTVDKNDAPAAKVP